MKLYLLGNLADWGSHQAEKPKIPKMFVVGLTRDILVDKKNRQ